MWWPALSWLLLAWMFATNNPKPLGKQPDGGISVLGWALFLPYFLFVWGFYHLKCLWLRRNEPCWHEVAAGGLVGRRPRRGELPAGVAHNVDLTSEFREVRSVVAAAEYRSLPVLNRSVPDVAQFRSFVEEAAACKGTVYVHCGAGRGRATMFAAALLLHKGLATRVDDAIDMVAAHRPGTHVHAIQRLAIQACIDDPA